MDKGLLEKYAGAAAAYSVRLLNRNYTGPLLKVRRVDAVTSQDNGEIFVFADNTGWISLDSKVIDPSNTSVASTLGGFVNASGYTDGDKTTIGTNTQHAYVSVWKDQSGNANDASQSVAGNQPQIVSGGVVIVDNGKPALFYNGDLMSINVNLSTFDFTLFAAYRKTTSAGQAGVFGIGSTTYLNIELNQYGPNLTTFYGNTSGSFSTLVKTVNETIQRLVSVTSGTSDIKMYDNSVLADSDTNIENKSTTTATIRPRTSAPINIQEIVVYPSDQSDNRTKIEENINDAFNIYSVALEPTEGSFLGKYPDAAAAYSTRNLTGRDKQPILKVRRELGTDTDTEQTIYSGSDGFLDKNQLLNFVNEVSEDPRLPLDISEGYGYSLRVVKAGYTGPLIQVRESGGNTTKDIYAGSDGNINISALETFCGSNDGHVSKWYNQSGVERTLEADAAANQPKIVESGVVVRNTLNSIALKFTNAGNEFLGIQDATAFDLQEQCIAMNFMSTALPTSGTDRILGLVNPTGTSLDLTIRNTVAISSLGHLILSTEASNETLASIAQTVNTPSILTFNFNGGSSSGTSNKTTQAGTLIANDIKGLAVGARFSVTSTADFLTSEVIQYTSAQTGDNKIEIEASLNKYYKVYGDAYVSTWYDQSLAADESYLLDSAPGAAAAYSLRKLREDYDGAAIEVRRDSDEASKTIGFTASGELDTDELINFCSGANGYVANWYNQAFNSKNELLLDTTEGQSAEAAYSVRQLSSTATECMVIRRASDSKLRTIGFKNKDIDEAAIESFCTGTTCTVYQWLDQSGNGNTATAPSTGAEPTIYTGGALVKENGRVAVEFDGTDDYFITSNGVANETELTIFQAGSSNPTGALYANQTVYSIPHSIPASTPWARVWISQYNTSDVEIRNNGTPYLFNNVYPQNETILTLNTKQGVFNVNGTLAATFTGADITYPNVMPFIIGANGAGTQNWKGNYQEVLVFGINKSGTDQTSIEENINNYYGIYSTNNAEQGVSLNQPKIYDSTFGIIEENGKPALDFDGSNDFFNTSLSQGTLTEFLYTGVAAPTTTTALQSLIDLRDANDDGTRVLFIDNGTIFTSTDAADSSTTYAAAQQLVTGEYDGTNLTTYVDGTGGTSVSGTDTTATANALIGVQLGASSFFMNGTMQELVLYFSDQSRNRLEIEGNINSNYRIYGSNDASQGTASAQPALVNNGRVILENGKPAIEFDGSNDTLLSGTFSAIPQPVTWYSISTQSVSSTGIQGLFRTSTTEHSFNFGEITNSSNAYAGSGMGAGATLSRGQTHLSTFLANSSSSAIYINGTTYRTGNAGTNPVSGVLQISRTQSPRYWNGTQQELILFSNSSNRTDIESNINRAFGVYWDGTQRSLLDDQPNAAAAYSVRALSSSYTGPLVEIRDANGNTQDIYATYNGDLDENAINDFCAGSTCTIATWYDQSGNNNNATQGTALNQPTIYTGGQLVKEGGRLALDFDGTGDFFGGISKPSSTPAETMAMVLRLDVTTDQRMVGHPTPTVGTGFPRFLINAGDFAYNDYEASPTITTRALSPADTNLNLIFADVNDTTKTAHIYKNGIAGTNGSTLTKPLQLLSYVETDIKLGSNRNGDDNFFNGKMQEYIRWDIDRAANRTNIESDINRYYDIYSRLPGDRLLNKFPGAAAAYSVRAINSLYLGPLIRVRRDSDNVHADVYVDVNLTISDTSKVGILSSSTDPIEPKSNTSLKTFMDGNNGFVAVWYDQASSNDASQSNAINQPKIYDSADGVIVENGKPAINYLSSGLGTLTMTSEIEVVTNIHVLKGETGTGFEQYILGALSSLDWYSVNGQLVASNTVAGQNTSLYLNGVSQNPYISRPTTQSLAFFNWNTGTSGTTQTISADRSTGGSNRSWKGTMQELILYTSSESDNRTNIESDINTFYNIYAKPKRLLDEFGGAAAAYSLRRLNSLYAGPLVKIRRDSDNVEVNVYPDLEGNFSLNSQVTNVAETTTGSSQVAFSYSTPYATLSQFVESSPNCFVVEWKDQSSNNNHATQNAAASQPKIYDGTTGVLDGVTFVYGKSLPTSLTSISTTSTSFIVGQKGSAGGGFILGNYGSDRWYACGENAVSSATTAGVTVSAYYGNGTEITTPVRSELFAAFTANPSLLSTIYSTAAGLSAQIGHTQYSGYGGQQIREFVIYHSDQSSNRTGIETNINTFYDIY